MVGLEKEEHWACPALPERPAPPRGMTANGGPPPGNGKVRFHDCACTLTQQQVPKCLVSLQGFTGQQGIPPVPSLITGPTFSPLSGDVF